MIEKIITDMGHIPHLPDGHAYPKLADPSVHTPQRGFGFSVEGVRA